MTRVRDAGGWLRFRLGESRTDGGGGTAGPPGLWLLALGVLMAIALHWEKSTCHRISRAQPIHAMSPLITHLCLRVTPQKFFIRTGMSYLAAGIT